MNPSELALYERNFQPSAAAQATMPQPRTKEQPKKKKGWLGAIAPFLPAIAGTAGVALAPFTGGGSLALLGLGAAGAAAGKVASNKIEGKGAFDNPANIALEGLFGAAGGAGKAFQLAKAAKTAKTAANVAEGANVASKTVKGADLAADALRGADAASEVNTLAKTGKLTARQKIANAMTQKGSGLKVGKTVGGASDLDEASMTLQRLKISGTPKQQLHAIETNMKNLSGQVDDLLTKKPIPVNGKNVRAQVAAALDDPNKYVELDLTTPGATKYLNMHLDKIGTAKSAKEVNDYIKVINPVAIRAQDKLIRGVALTDKETAALAAKKAGDEVLSVIPELKPLKKDMAILFSRNAEVANQFGKAANIPVVGGILKAPASAARYAESKAGQVLAGQGAGGVQDAAEAAALVASGGKGNIRSLIKPALIQQVGSGIAEGAITPPAPEETIDPNEPGVLSPEEQAQREQMIAENILGGMSPEERMQLGADGGGAAGGGLGDSISPQQLLQMVANDPENANTYIALYKTLESSNKAAKPMSAEASKIVTNAQAGIEGINDIRGTIEKDPGVLKRTLVPGRGLFGGLLGNAVGTNEFEAGRQQVVDVIARLRTGAAISKTEEERFLKFLPQPFDSPAVREQKLGYLQRQFQRVAQQNPQAATDIEAALATAGADSGAGAY